VVGGSKYGAVDDRKADLILHCRARLPAPLAIRHHASWKAGETGRNSELVLGRSREEDHPEGDMALA